MSEERKLIERLRLLSEEPDDSYSLAAAALEAALALIDALVPDVRTVITDHYSGLPEHRQPALGAFARLDRILNDDDGNPRQALAVVPVETQEAAACTCTVESVYLDGMTREQAFREPDCPVHGETQEAAEQTEAT